MCSWFFEINKSTASHNSITILGLKFKWLKKTVLKDRANFIEYYTSFSNPSEIPPAEGQLRTIQKANLEILKRFEKICEDNNIKYWMDFGTLLGAIRHKGFIPWDDDLDVGMMRDDYEKFISLFKDGFPNNPELSIYFENNKRSKCFAKVAVKGSENLFIDIFPYDYHYSKLNQEEKAELSLKIRDITKNKGFRIYKTVEDIQNKFKKVTKKALLENKEADNSIEPAIFMGIDFPHNWKNKVYDYENIFPIKKIEFEGNLLSAPNMPEVVLKSIYGDYMRLPKDCYPRHSNYIEMEENEKRFLEELTK